MSSRPLPKITMTLLVRNEADILEENIRFHHAMGVDSFIVMDNLSTDDTPDLLARLGVEFDIEVLRQEDDDYAQGTWVTEMARRAARERGADWVINNDADEFWLPEQGTLRDLLASLPPETAVLSVARHNAVVTAPADAPLEGRSHPRQTVVFEAQSRNATGQPLPGKVLHRASLEVTVAQGNHAVSALDGAVEEAGTRLRILHFPYRSLAHYKDKIRLGGAAYARNTTLPVGVGATWRTHYSALAGGAGLDQFWAELTQTPEEVTIGQYVGDLFACDTLRAFFAAPAALDVARAHLLTRSAELVRDFATSQAHFISRAGRDLRWHRPMYYNLRFAVASAEAHLERLTALVQGREARALCRSFAELRDVFSLFPRNGFLRDFLAVLLEQSCPEAVARLRADCAGKRVILHTSCRPRFNASAETVASFARLEGAYHHIILYGAEGSPSEAQTPLGFDYDGRFLKVPAPDNYEGLHRKLFYAYLLFDLLTTPELVVKIDDNILMQDAPAFAACLDRVAAAKVACAGRRVGGERHDGQWHGWHIGKCADPLIETRGYQYPLPRDYAAGGHGYVLGPEGLRACGYMYLAMQAFFAMPAVGLEDACVGHALYAQNMELMDLSDPDNLLALPGLTTKESLRRDRAWRAVMGDPGDQG
ncbi:glycosyltransferase family 2 protein [Phaeobacter gallaeciensis]|uniref:glycosyltransferase family 2 protein n=1 Tax=Phaeobacter gallaeciensis TaxID=60890 RepID=UPI0023806955|nr:glycosyltransferase family 2 protein [Phaeobacter gallaeciensis]MDE4276428.1 glycosyltransferase family 2 protein [Phaeobacter gallaeciensis]MDE4301593.1 glycosyltransferase family 2 protein [Phaeobacter gallaeciensis]MDE5186748.1 glycosyltransferase family 2 protein [Phaeobacter gallaeciensis]